jgi:hypothetical protein
MDENKIISILAIVCSVGGIIIGIINHKRIISRCNNRNIDISLDIVKTPTPEINNV